jgi:short-subunit dehydrogenase
MTDVALVTGASSGIGRELAKQLAGRGWDLALAARRVELMEDLARELEAQHGVRVRVFRSDLTRSDAARRLFDEVTGEGLSVMYLINNAGATLEGRYLDHSAEAQRGNINLMAVAPAELMHLCLPAMLEAGEGRVLNLGSLGAFWPCFPGITIYAGSKWLVLNLTRTLALEYADEGVRFSVCVPFTTDTAFLDTPTNREIVARMPKFMVQSPEKVARIALEGVEAGRIVQHTALHNRILASLLKLLPPTLVGKAIVRYMSIGRDDLEVSR